MTIVSPLVLVRSLMASVLLAKELLLLLQERRLLLIHNVIHVLLGCIPLCGN